MLIRNLPGGKLGAVLTVEQRRALAIPESLIRYSVGIENPEDLIADLEGALSG